MDRSLLAQRYARALYEFAEQKKQGRSVMKEMKLLAELWKSVPELKKVLESPLVESDRKIALLQSAIQPDKSDVSLRFYRLVALHDRLFLLGRMARAYVELWNKEHGIVRASLTTVGKVGPALSLQLEELVRKSVGDRKVEFSRSYDPEIIGGFIMQVEDLRIDASVSRQLEYIKMNLLQ